MKWTADGGRLLVRYPEKQHELLGGILIIRSRHPNLPIELAGVGSMREPKTQTIYQSTSQKRFETLRENLYSMQHDKETTQWEEHL